MKAHWNWERSSLLVGVSPRVRAGWRAGVQGVLVAAVIATQSLTAEAGDWPQILGENRNSVAVNESPLPAVFAEDAIRLRWEIPVGEGFAGVAVAGDQVVVFHRQGDDEIVAAVHAETGKMLWSTPSPASYQGRVNPDVGPRAVPLISGNRVVVWGAAGVATCLELETGKLLWQRDLFGELRGDENYFGAGSAPLLIGQTLIFNVGGRQGAGIVGLDLESGVTRWQATNEGTSYAAPVAMEVAGETLALVPTRLQLVALDPSNGAEKFRIPFGKTGPTVNAAVPLVDQDQVFITASYGIGSMLLNVSNQGFEKVWENEEAFASQYFTPVLHNGHLYGTDGREDFSDTQIRCAEWGTGVVKWSEPLSGAHVILVGEDLLAVSIDGSLTILKATPAGFEKKFQGTILESPGRALPAYSNGRLFVRSNAIQERGVLRCWQVVAE